MDASRARSQATRRGIVAIATIIIGAVAIAGRPFLARTAIAAYQRARGRATVEERLEQHGAAAVARLRPCFARAGVGLPPARLRLVAFKDERRLELFAGDSAGPFRFVRSYAIVAASGTLGPKLREGDCQVPEGIYGVAALNPNSLFHLSLRVDYPNEADREQARRDGRTDLGGDIMIHGGGSSVGCLALGDEAAEDLFVLAAMAGARNVSVILSPVDFRVRDVPSGVRVLPWLAKRHEEIGRELRALGRPASVP